MNPPELITDANSYKILKVDCESLIDTKAQLPSFVFRRRLAQYCVLEHACISKDNFGKFLKELATFFGDKLVNYLTLEPDAETYYHQKLGFYGIASFEATVIDSRYRSVMARAGSPDSFLSRGGDRGCFWGSSRNWGIMCDRISWELALVGTSKPIKMREICDFRCLSPDQVLGYEKSQYSHQPSIPENFVRELLRNYPELEKEAANDT